MIRNLEPETKITEERDIYGWVKGTVGKYTFSAKVFDIGSTFGIDNGKVSKLQIWDEEIRQKEKNIFTASIVNYDRGWDIKPNTPEEDMHFQSVMRLFQ